MKRLLAGLLCGLVAVSTGMGVSAVESGKNMGIVQGTTAEMVLDAVKDEAYDEGLYINGSTYADGSTSDATVDYWVTYTADELWIYVEVLDDTLDVVNADVTKPSYLADSLEIMIDPTNEGLNEPDVTPWQMRIDSYSLISARKGQQGTSLYLPAAEGGTVDFFEAVSEKTDGGFRAEYMVPMDDLTEGRHIGFTFCYNDWDSDGANRVIPITTLGETSTSWTPDQYNYMELGAIYDKVPLVEEAEVVEQATAPATADPLTLLAAAVLCSGAVTVVSKKKR